MIERATIVKKIDSLPTLPVGVARLSQLLGDEMASAKDFEEVILPDPSLTANLLRLANSAYFGLRREITSVRQAVTLMGIKRVFEVAASAAFSKVIPNVIPGYDILAVDFWKHSIAVAVISEQLAAEIKIPAPQLLFTAGLLHDMGKLAIGSFLMEESDEIIKQIHSQEITYVDAEKAILGTDHIEVGEDVANKWELPEAIAWGARWHHCPGNAPEEVDPMLVHLVHVADGLAHSVGYGADNGELHRRLETQSVEKLNLRVQSLETVVCETMDQIKQLGSLFEGV